VPFSAAILMALFALCGFGAFLFVTTQYLQDVRGMSALTAGLCLLPVGAGVVVLSPRTGRLVGARGPRLPLVASGAALALGGGASIWLGPATPLPAVLAIYLLFGIFLGTVNPPITNTAVSGMPRSMAGVATSLASTGRQTGTTLGVAISGTIAGSALARGGTAFTSAERGVWWLVLGLGVGILVLGVLSTGRWALDTAGRAAALFEEVDRGRRREDVTESTLLTLASSSICIWAAGPVTATAETKPVACGCGTYAAGADRPTGVEAVPGHDDVRTAV